MIFILHLEATQECHQLRDAGKGEQGPRVPPCPPKYDLSLQPSPCLPRPGQGVSLFPNCSLTPYEALDPQELDAALVPGLSLVLPPLSSSEKHPGPKPEMQNGVPRITSMTATQDSRCVGSRSRSDLGDRRHT